jgi:glycosyltransferase involved in cell wall biosynthesis
MTRQPDVTFVVPNYNGAAYLRQTLESILAQRDPDFRVVMADNCSTDASIDIARSYHDDRLTVALADTHVSMSENWTRALGYIDTPYGVLAHSDDVYEPDYLAVMMPLIRGHGNAFAAHCKVAYIDEHGDGLDLPLETYKDRFWPDADPYCRPACDEAAWLRRGNYILAPAAIYRMEWVRAIGAFNPRFQFVPDWEYWLRGVFAGYQIAGTRRRLVKYRKHSRSLTSAAEASLSRYQEEIELLTWLAGRGFSAGCFPDPHPEYGLVGNTLMTEFADRLARGDAAGATRLAVFGRANIPRFRWSVRDLAMRCALGLGVAGGLALVRLRALYLRYLAAQPWGRTSRP